jgi:hypothetical protein
MLTICKSSLRLLACVLVVGPAHASNLWRVDATGAGDFVQIQQAVNAASDGDVLLVSSGSYASFVVDDKQLGIFAEDGALVTTGTIRVRNLSSTKSLTVVGLDAQGMPGATRSASVGLFATQCAGALRWRDCSFGGGIASSASAHNGWEGAFVESCDDVAFTDCWFQGANDFGDYPDYERRAGHGLNLEDSTTALFNSQAHGGDATSVDEWQYGADGGNGIRSQGGELFIASSVLSGGDGGATGDCGHPGDGGDGLRKVGGTCRVRDLTATGGTGGGCTPCELWACAEVGYDGYSAYGPITDLGGSQMSFRTQRTAALGTQVNFTIDAAPGALVLLRAAPSAGHEFQAAVQAPLLLSEPLYGFPFSRTGPSSWPGVPLGLSSPVLGIVPASGSLQVNTTVDASAGIPHIIRLQALVRRAAGTGTLIDPVDLLVY